MKIIKYQLMTEVNHGTEEEPNIVQTFNACEIRCNDSNFEANYTLAKAEAYNGEVTVEDISDETSIQDQIASLKAELEATDYKIIKCSEAQLVGEELPYDIQTLHAERQAIRNQINELEKQLEGGNE